MESQAILFFIFRGDNIAKIATAKYLRVSDSISGVPMAARQI